MAPESTTRPNPNSAKVWLPACRAVAEEFPVNVPNTRLVEFDFMDCFDVVDGENPDAYPKEELEDAMEDVGRNLFMRTDVTSAKHDGIDNVLVTGEDDLHRIAGHLIEDASKKMLTPGAFMLRQWITVDNQFWAFDGLPIGLEFRLFAREDEHHCTHYYWPEEALEGHVDGDGPAWPEARDRMADHDVPDWLPEAAQLAAKEANENLGIEDVAWSVDFARDDHDRWWLIDMAVGVDSWHPDCEEEEVIALDAR